VRTPEAYLEGRARMNFSNTSGSTRIALETLTCGNSPRSHSRYTVALHTPSLKDAFAVLRDSTAELRAARTNSAERLG
jgi:hypothetical protein